MKPKNMLLVLIIVVMIPEILLASYIFGKYTTILGFEQFPTSDILAFFISNPLFFVLALVVFIATLILYLTLQAK